MEISQDEFDKRLNNLADKNWKVKNLLSEDKGHGRYEKLPQNVKDLIDKELGVTRTVRAILTVNK